MSYPPSPTPWPPAPAAPPAASPRPPRRFSRLSAIFLSFFSADLYRDVARAWRGIGLLYLLLLAALTWLPVAIKGHVGFRKFVRNDAPAVIEQVPTLTIDKGVVSIKEPEPYIMRDPQTGRAFLYVDTTGAFDRPEAKDAVMLLSRSKLEVRQPNKTEVYDLSQVDHLYVDKVVAARWMNASANWVGPAAFAGGMIGSLVWGIIRLLLYALIGLIFVSSFHARLDYAALMRLSAVAMTPGMALDTLAWAFNFGWLPCCGWSFIIGAITLGYLAFAVRANAEPRPPPGSYVPGFPTTAQPYPGAPPQGAYTPPPGYPPQQTYPPPPSYPPPQTYPPPQGYPPSSGRT